MFGRRKSEFARAMQDYGLQRCSMAGGRLNIGLGPEQGDAPVAGLPAPLRHVAFLEAPLQAGLIAAFLASPEARQVENLMIGTSHAYAEQRMGGYDFAPALAAFRGAALPRLKILWLGDMEMLFNGHKYFGHLGDIAPILAATPALEDLRLFGGFDLATPLRHGTLREIGVQVDDIGVTGGPLSQKTVASLLASDLPALTDLELALDDEDATYPVPQKPSNFPRLARFSMSNLSASDQARAVAWIHRAP